MAEFIAAFAIVILIGVVVVWTVACFGNLLGWWNI